jgi:hypothetical protein
VLMEGVQLADATPIFHQGRWWLFAAAAEHGSLDQDELLIFHSERLAGPWQPHSGNPVKSDCRSARPGGRIIRRGRRLLRPAQDCEAAYGAGLVWLEIVELTPARFREREIARWDGFRDLEVAGIHSFDRLGELEVIDFRTTIRRGRRTASRRVAFSSGSAVHSAAAVAGTGVDSSVVSLSSGEAPVRVAEPGMMKFSDA